MASTASVPEAPRAGLHCDSPLPPALAATPPKATSQLRDLLEGPDREGSGRDGSGRFLVAVEIETTRGLAMGERSSRASFLAHQLAEYDGVDLLCLTDNPGGHPQIRPEVLGEDLLARGQEVVINVACKDYNRNGIEGRLWALGSTGLNNVLALTGDYPTDGFDGRAQPVFDIDSVGLLQMIRQMNEGMPAPGRRAARGGTALERASFYPGASVNPYKRLESEYLPQLHKLELKIQTGARWVVTQIGYDSRRLDDLRRYLDVRQIGVPLLGSIFILTAPAARLFSRSGIPGVAATPELVSLAERHASSEDRGRAFFLEFAARQLAVLKGLGYRGVYISGRPSFRHVETILELERSFGPDDWKGFAREIAFSRQDEFYYFERDPDTGLASDEVNRRYVASKSRRARLRSRLTLPLPYRLGRFAHDLFFGPRAPGFGLGRAFYRVMERMGAPARRLAHAVEQSAKVPVYGCRDCGDCSLPDVAYLCPESQCVKNQRNGPCGGTHDGMCEVLDKECIWSRAYDRLKPYGQEKQILERPVIMKDGALQGTSAWANTFLGRDHSAKPAASESGRSDQVGSPNH